MYSFIADMLRKALYGAVIAPIATAVWIPYHVKGVCYRRDFNTWNFINDWNKDTIKMFLDCLQASEWQVQHPYKTFFSWYGWTTLPKISRRPVNVDYWNGTLSDNTFNNIRILNNIRSLPEEEYENAIENL